MDFLKIVEKFQIEGRFVSAEKYGRGHINDTYLVETSAKKYILQKINHTVFKNVEGLMSNIVGVTEFIASKSTSTNQAELLRVIKTTDGQSFLKTNEGYFRLYNFISAGISIETTPSEEQLRVAGSAFGSFQNLLFEYPAEKLFETIVDFHNTEARYKNFEQAIFENKANRLNEVGEEIEFFKSRKSYASKVRKLIANGSIPLRVTHNDTKLNNVLIDVKNMRPVAVIDLDTIMAGSSLYDFGDSIRSGANVGTEDGTRQAGFSIELFSAFCSGFISELRGKLTDLEVENMAFGAILMTYECGMRFLTDYLDGDVYFKTSSPRQNLNRAKSQMKMVEEMEKALPQMTAIVKKIYYI